MKVELLVFMQTEDEMVTFERKGGDTIIYPLCYVPAPYKEGDIIKAIVHGEEYIEFIELDVDEMNVRRAAMQEKIARLRKRARRGSYRK